jgi:hypothetical protein
MAAMGLLEEVYRLPLVSPRAASRERILRVLGELGLVLDPAAISGRSGRGLATA